MKNVISTEAKPIKLWLDDIEDGALAQAKNLANLPFVFRHIAIMPDAHQGYGMPIGGVMATEAFSTILPDTEYGKLINIAHNYAAMEHHFGKNVMVHRKGATKAQVGQVGIIPGSQGTASYIVEGLGNRESFESCSHGAGRRMGRKQAQRELNLTDEKKFLDDLGVIHSVRNEKDLDEAPGAYKDIYIVMKNQSDLVSVLVELKPLAVIKG